MNGLELATTLVFKAVQLHLYRSVSVWNRGQQSEPRWAHSATRSYSAYLTSYTLHARVVPRQA